MALQWFRRTLLRWEAVDVDDRELAEWEKRARARMESRVVGDLYAIVSFVALGEDCVTVRFIGDAPFEMHVADNLEAGKLLVRARYDCDQ